MAQEGEPELTKTQSRAHSLAMTHGSMHMERDFRLAITHEGMHALEVDYPYTQLPNQMSYPHAMTYFVWTREG